MSWWNAVHAYLLYCCPSFHPMSKLDVYLSVSRVSKITISPKQNKYSQRLTGRGRTITMKINHNKSTALKRSVINNWGRGVGLNRFHVQATLALGSVMVHKHTRCSARVKDFYSSMYQTSKHINEPAHEIMVLITKANSEGSDKPAHPRSLARAFAVCTHEEWK